MTLICASVTSQKEAASAVLQGAEVIEWRFDLFSSLPEQFEFSKSVINIAAFKNLENHDLIKKVFDAGCDFADIDESSPLRHMFPKDKIIVSHHDFEKTPSADEILEILCRLEKYGTPKTAFMVSSAADLHEIAKAASEFQKTGKRFILTGMGECGKLTRIRAEHLGSFLTYYHAGTQTAAGQLHISEAKHYDFVCGVAGWPLEKTLSPAIHNAAFKKAGLNGYYLRLPCKPEDIALLPELINAYDLTGLNITIPHKQHIIPHLASLAESAEKTGAVNTITRDLKGYNTDITGIAASFKDVLKKNVLIIGAGGAGRSAAYYFMNTGAHLFITNRTKEKAVNLAAEFHAEQVEKPETQNYDIIVNATPITPECTFSSGQTVMDMNYTDSAFLKKAEKAGAETISGKTMLIHQAAESFRIWTGITPDTAVMEKAAEEEK